MHALAQAVAAECPGDQVLLVGWGDLADHVPDSATAVRDAWATADVIAAKIRAARLRGARVNLIGFSMGGEVEDRLAADLGGVNRLIAIDPAADQTIDDKGRPISGLPRFKRHARYSIAFHCTSSLPASLSADDTVLMRNLPGTQIEQHVQSLYVFTTMMRRDAGLEPLGDDAISPQFSLSNLLSGKLPAWRKNAYSNGYEAQLSCGTTTVNGPLQFAPRWMAYVDRRGRTQLAFAS
jgi:pimeloyl-ACP methyl ester carboxylesterase